MNAQEALLPPWVGDVRTFSGCLQKPVLDAPRSVKFFDVRPSQKLPAFPRSKWIFARANLQTVEQLYPTPTLPSEFALIRGLGARVHVKAVRGVGGRGRWGQRAGELQRRKNSKIVKGKGGT